MSEWIKRSEQEPPEGVTVPLTMGQVAIVDREDAIRVGRFRWHAKRRADGGGFYAVKSYGVSMHRFLMGASDGLIVDHRDGDGLNNRRSNLRIGTQSQNCVNRQRTPGRHLRGTGPKGRRWRAQIKYRGKIKSLGYFDTEEEAHNAYLMAARELHGDWLPTACRKALEER